MKSIADGIRERRSIRKYRANAPVAEEDLKLILEAGMVAPSAGNSQQREFFVVSNRGAIEALSKVHRYAGFLLGAPPCVVICGVPDGDGTGMAPYWPQDRSAAAQNILLQAYALGYGTCGRRLSARGPGQGGREDTRGAERALCDHLRGRARGSARGPQPLCAGKGAFRALNDWKREE